MADPFTLPPLPFDKNALEPAISPQTLEYHYGKHHAGYVAKLNKLVPGTPFADMGLEDVVRESAGKAANAAVFNNAAQVWNHTFYWNSLAPKPSAPSGKLVQAIEAYGGLDKLKADLAEAATAQFGSGWAWLVAEDGKLALRKTANAETPMVRGTACLLTIDVWEHAYYLDYQNKRADYVAAVMDRLLNWDFATENFEKA